MLSKQLKKHNENDREDLLDKVVRKGLPEGVAFAQSAEGYNVNHLKRQRTLLTITSLNAVIYRRKTNLTTGQ